jgi:hypothetical protein
MFTRAVAASQLMVALVGSALPGQASQAAPGSRIRVRPISGPTIEGRLLAIESDSLILRSEQGQISVPRTAVRSLETWRGRGSHWRTGAEIGWLAGFGAASAVYANRMRNCIGVACAKIVRWKVYAATGGLAGAVVVGLVGAAFRHDRWERVPLGPVRPQVVVGAGAASVAVSIPF